MKILILSEDDMAFLEEFDKVVPPKRISEAKHG